MKVLAGILGILGGLLGLFVFLLYLIQGLGLGVPAATGTIDAVVGYVGGLAALTCILAGVGVLFTPGWMAGVVLFVAALVGVVLGGYFSMSLALIGGMVAMANGRRRMNSEGLQERLELEVRQRYGAGL